MSTGLHKDLEISEIHRLQSLEYANAAARTGATGLTSDDIGRVARQTDNDSFWILCDDSPLTWQQVGSSMADVGPSILLWGDDGIATTTTTRYMTPGYDDGVAETAVAAFRSPAAGTAKNMRVRHNTAGVGAATLTYTLVVNGVPSALSVAMSNTVQDGSDLSNTVSIAAGDLLSIQVTKSAAITTSPDNIVVSMEVAA